MHLVIFTLFLILLSLYLILWQRYNYQRRKLSPIKCLKSRFPLGQFSYILAMGRPSAIPMGVYTFEALQGIAKLFEGEDMFSIDIGPKPLVGLHSAEAAMDLLKDKNEVKKPTEFNTFNVILTDSLLTSEGGASYKAIKKNVMSFFNATNMKALLEMNLDVAEKALREIKPLDSTFRTNITALLTDYTLGTSIKLVTGADSLGEDIDSIINVKVKRVFQITVERIFRPWLYPDFLFKLSSLGKEVLEIKAFVTQKIREVYKLKFENEKTNVRSSFSMYEHLLAKKQGQENLLTDKEIDIHILTLLIAAYDTTKESLIWALFVIGQHPDVQVKIQAELDTVLNNKPFSKISYEDLKNLKYLNCVIKESLRLCPIFPVFGRLLKDDFTARGKVIPKGTTVGIFVDHIHKSDRYYEKPKEFIPERFLDENSVGRHPYAFIPFSAGPRSCPGMMYAYQSMTTIVGSILHKYDIKSLKSMDSLLPCFEMVNIALNDVIMDFTPRKLKTHI